MTIKVCDSFEDAFSLCREANKPMTVYVRDELGRVFPSGRFEPLPSRDDHADAIGALQAENRRLREALRVMIQEWVAVMGDESENRTPGDVLEKARAALEGKP